MAFIDAHRHEVVDGKELGVEPICSVLSQAGLQVAASTYYAAKTRQRATDAARSCVRRRARCVNRTGIDGGSEPARGWSGVSTEEVSRGVA